MKRLNKFRIISSLILKDWIRRFVQIPMSSTTFIPGERQTIRIMSERRKNATLIKLKLVVVSLATRNIRSLQDLQRIFQDARIADLKDTCAANARVFSLVIQKQWAPTTFGPKEQNPFSSPLLSIQPGARHANPCSSLTQKTRELQAKPDVMCVTTL